MTFDDACDRVLGHEGGYVLDEHDPGGETHWGISKRSYPDVNIAKLTKCEAQAIYRRDFWDLLGGTELPDGVAYQLFDFAVNSGIATAIRGLQRAVGVADDGHWGPISRRALAARSESDVIKGLIAERLDYMTRLSTWPHHGKGWTRRMAANLRYGIEDS